MLFQCGSRQPASARRQNTHALPLSSTIPRRPTSPRLIWVGLPGISEGDEGDGKAQNWPQAEVREVLYTRQHACHYIWRCACSKRPCRITCVSSLLLYSSGRWFSSFKRLGNMLLLKCTCNSAGFTSFCAIAGRRSTVSSSMSSAGPCPPSTQLLGARQGSVLPGAHLAPRGHEACTLSSTQRCLRSTFPMLSLHSHEVQLPPHFAALCAHLISPILFLTSPIIQP